MGDLPRLTPPRPLPRPPGAAAAAVTHPVGRRGAAEVEELYHMLRPALAGLHLEEAHLHLAWEVAFWEPELEPEDRRHLFLLALVTHAATQSGSTRLPMGSGTAGGLLRIILDALVGAADDGHGLEPAKLVTSIRELVHSGRVTRTVGAPGEVHPLVLEGDALYQHRAHRAELECALRLQQLLAAGDGLPARTDRSLKKALEEACKLGDLELSAHQQKAVETAGCHPLAVISGGPGTGKTSILVAILRLLAWLDVSPREVMLAAPTGKAAHRMNQAIGSRLDHLSAFSLVDLRVQREWRPAETLHRLLGYSPVAGRFRHHEGNPLPARAVVVDEASMIDLRLMVRLLAALRPGTRLILLGDADQLPSVAAGAVFRDLSRQSRALPGARHFTVQLEESYRMDPRDPEGRAIYVAATAVRAGDSPLAEGAMERAAAALAERDAERAGGPVPRITRVQKADELQQRGVEWLPLGDDAEGLGEVLTTWFERRLLEPDDLLLLRNHAFHWRDDVLDASDQPLLDRLLALLSASRILTLTRGTRTGCIAINSSMQDRLRVRAKLEGRHALHAGEPVMMLKNDYGRGVFNGDQGVLVWSRHDDGPVRLACVFPGTSPTEPHRVLSPRALEGSLELCYAMTIHKSQGSEFAHTAVILPEEPIPLLTRELLYTGITRSSRSVTLVGREDVLAAGAKRKIERFTGLAERLR